MHEAQRFGVEGLARQGFFDGGDVRIAGSAAVGGVGEERRAGALRQMNPDLMRAPRLEAAAYERRTIPGEALLHVDVGHRGSALVDLARELDARHAAAPVERADDAASRHAERDAAV